jgi:hypothetical protein
MCFLVCELINFTLRSRDVFLCWSSVWKQFSPRNVWNLREIVHSHSDSADGTTSA